MDVGAHLRDVLSVAVLGFSAYAALLLWRAANGDAWAQRGIFIWLDACWFLLFVLLAREAMARFYLLLFFPIFFAAWRWGRAESLALSVFSALASVVVIGLANPHISWTQHLGMPLSLFVVGPLGILLAGAEAARRKNHSFVTRVVEDIDTRHGFDIILPEVLSQIGQQFHCNAAVIALRHFDGRDRVICWEIQHGSSELSDNAARTFVDRALSLPGTSAFAFAAKRHWWQREQLVRATPSDREAIVSLVELLEFPQLISAPVPAPGVGRMRIFLTGDEVEITPSNLDMLHHVMEQIAPSVENAYLREQLASETADAERARIGRDLHDSAIQPYIGLKFAIEAVQHRIDPKDPLWPDLAALAEMATSELAAMRDVISELRGAPGKGGGLLASAVRRQAARFSQLFGIEIQLEVDGDMPVSRRIAGELFHMVAEGLSNIRRHTRARHASITLSARGDALVLCISNEGDGNTAPVEFVPRSLAERTQALNGRIEIVRDANSTALTITIPLPHKRQPESQNVQ